ncbi:MAG: N-6 DNA methylase [Nautiliaceae bacterium]
MITKENFKNVLRKLNFEEKDNVFIKKFGDFELKADFNNEKLIYPNELKVNDLTTSNFSKPENFVVFECVYRLLNKGYLPKHIELEPEWRLGHLDKSGKADIAIKDNEDKTLVIIECKTWGAEYEKALKLTQLDGGQIFSYAANSGAKYISLYTSNENLDYKYFLIKLIDVEENLDKEKNYEKARKGELGDIAKALFEVWSEVYKKEGIRGLFDDEFRAYELEKSVFSLKDLKIVKEEDISGIYHKFATVLRAHNVSGRENAFDKLVNLLLCKIVDEKENPDNLQFFWRGFAIDDPFSFQDRLQKLYKEGMKEFLNEDITYIDNQDIEKYFKSFEIETIKEKVKEAIKKLKFFTTNDFAFIEVHNEKLFYQNFEVLRKIVLLFQDIYLTNSEENQFLGDLFEGFLDQGIKQNEGQFFTPMPIVKFIVSSLPKKEYKSMIDYACGAGHFLNEFAKNHKQAKVVGIEKEYRLSKVAKVSSFMYGNEVEIIYDDALKKDVVKDEFEVLISNPPYSVKGFLETLKKEDTEKFELSKFVDVKQYSTNNSIECFFVEKTKHILKDKGLAAIILPISILDKTNSALFIKTRELLLKYFEIKAIVKLPTNTFGKTGTTTVILYLKKRDLKEDFTKKAEEISREVYDGNVNILENFEDKEVLKTYCDYFGYDFEEYKEFLSDELEINLKEI